MRVAFLGSRGIPASYGGNETFFEELALGLVEYGASEVIVYCRSAYYDSRPANYQGVYLVYIPVPRIKAMESLLHSFLSSIHVLGQKVDVVYFVDPANAPFCLLLRIFGRKVVLHTNGLGWKRSKWGPLARRYYKFTEWLCARTAHALVTDNPVMTEYYREEYGTDSFYIPFGAGNRYGIDETVHEHLGLVPDRYLLVVARLEPENNTALIVKEYVRSRLEMPLVIVGDSPYDSGFLAHLQNLANVNVLFVGRINDQEKLNALYKGAYLYIHGHEVGGTNPSLLRAMQAGAAPVVIDVPFNTSVIGGAGIVFNRDPGNLSNLLRRLMSNPEEVKEVGAKAQAHVEKNFTWGKVVKDHELLFHKVAGN